MRLTKLRMLGAVVLLIVSTVCVFAQSDAQRATHVRVDKAAVFGQLFVTMGGKETKISDDAQQAWIINGGQHVVYSSSKGAGGYENEGQSLHLYDVATGKHRRIMSEYYMVDDVKEVVTSNKKRALLVTMSDGGLGASYVTVVDPWRGEVFFRQWARVLSQSGDTIVLGRYREADWDKLNSGEEAKVRPYKRERYDLKLLLKRRVIFNKRWPVV